MVDLNNSNMVGEHYGEHMKLKHAYELFPDLDLLVVQDDPEDINCEDITLYGVTTHDKSEELWNALDSNGLPMVIRISSCCRRSPIGGLRKGFVGVQF